MQALAQCDNVHVYYPCAEEEVICDLEQYTDPIHYSPKVNQWITEKWPPSFRSHAPGDPWLWKKCANWPGTIPMRSLFALYRPFSFP